MKNLQCDATANTPLINCDVNGSITIEGESRPENVRAFYAPLFNWLTEFEEEQKQITPADKAKVFKMNFKLDYFNSSSLKIFMEVVDHLKRISSNVNNMRLDLNWYYQEDDEDILDSGKEIEKMIGTKMNFVAQ